MSGRLELGVLDFANESSASIAGRVSRALGVDVIVITAEAPRNQVQVCDASGRSYCFNPMRAGTLVNNGQWVCTMGFHVQNKSNTAQKAFVLAGHCPYTSSNDWYMLQYGFVGAVWTGKQLYKDFGQDFVVVHLPSNQVSRQVYDTSRSVSGSGNPMTGEPICISPGQTDEDTNGGVQCSGTVRNANVSWISDGFIIRGADADGFSTRDGDSGSPIYRQVGGGAVAVGVHNTAQGGFAKMQDGLNATNFSIH